MLDRLRRFIADFGSEEPSGDSDGRDTRLAAAALLVHAISADGAVSDTERKALLAALQRDYGLDAGQAAKLFEEAKLRDDEAVDLYGFTSVLKRQLDEDERQRLIGVMWELILADGTVHEFEDNIVWRVAELLGVSTRDRVRLRKEVEINRQG
jgi:uncharacterized tellurite resistance protein B-like protein